MPARTVVVGVDGSDQGRAALAFGVECVDDGGTLIAVHVLQPPEELSARLESISPSERAHQRSILAEAAASARTLGITVQTLAAIGEPRTELLRAAEEHGADLLVVGHGPKSGFDFVDKPVWQAVIYESTIPVAVAPGEPPARSR